MGARRTLLQWEAGEFILHALGNVDIEGTYF